MIRRSGLAWLFVGIMIMLAPSLTVAEQTTGRNVVKAGYAPVDGLKMY